MPHHYAPLINCDLSTSKSPIGPASRKYNGRRRRRSLALRRRSATTLANTDDASYDATRSNNLLSFSPSPSLSLSLSLFLSFLFFSFLFFSFSFSPPCVFVTDHRKSRSLASVVSFPFLFFSYSRHPTLSPPTPHPHPPFARFLPFHFARFILLPFVLLSFEERAISDFQSISSSGSRPEMKFMEATLNSE